eukprot:evm.model.scf_206EXC.8 EVM.evm.TU.scf_206EXC.8   scf_206EXC:80995-86740(-)
MERGQQALTDTTAHTSEDSYRKRKADDEEGGVPAKRSRRGGQKRKGQKKNARGQTPPANGPPPAGAVNPADYVRVVPVGKRASGGGGVEGEGAEGVVLSRVDKASMMKVEDGRRVTSSKGYRTVRATHGAHEGCWYFEVKVTHLGATGHCRIGWATRKAELQAPVGYDQYGFSYRDIGGTKQNKAWRSEYGEPYSEGDTIGCFLHMPPGGRPLKQKTPKEIVKWKGGLYYVDDEPEQEPQILPGSMVAFSKNGCFQGEAYRDILEGTYCPAASIYTLPEQTDGATLTFNFGPDFEYGPPEVEGIPCGRPASDLATASSPKADDKDGDASGGGVEEGAQKLENDSDKKDESPKNADEAAEKVEKPVEDAGKGGDAVEAS